MTDQITVSSLVGEIIEQLTKSYIFPDRASKAATLLRTNLAAGSYDSPVGYDLCERLNADLFRACADKHLRLIWHESAQTSQDETALIAELRETFRLENYGIRCVERLPGNIGNIALTVIPEASTGGPAICAAMQLVQHTNALIFDLRDTRGGSPDGVTLMCSFLFSDGEVHLSDFVAGPNGPTQQFWTMAYIPGPRYLDRPVYILTSTNTFSGGEAFAYDLQALNRAVIIGEVTRGGAHPSEVVSLSEHIELRLPVARSVNPVTGENWEAVGVQPNVSVSAADAFKVAYRTALEQIADTPDVSAVKKEEAQRVLDELQT